MKLIDVDLRLLRTMPIEEPEGETDKDARGRVLFIGGSALSPGAAALAGEAALRAGAGKLLAGVPAAIAQPLGIAHPEFGILSLAETDRGEPDERAYDHIEEKLEYCDAILLGPGMTDERNACAIARKLLARNYKTLILDAAAITGFHDDAQALRCARCMRILTPHAGELASLTATTRQSVLADPARTAARAASEFGSIIVLKGAVTHIAHPHGEVWRHEGGVPGLGTAGSGDVLAGLMVGLIARGASAISACLWSVYLHAQAGAQLSEEVGRIGFLARELLALFPRLLEESSVRPEGSGRVTG